MVSLGIGEAAGLATSISWAASCQVHTAASRILGGLNVTAARVPLYLAGIGLAAFLSGAEVSLPAGAAVFIILSGLTGIALCDPLLYSASVVIGPRLALLIQSLSACLTAVLGHLFLGESINLVGWFGIVTASGGVAFVLMEGGMKSGADLSGLSRAQFWRGLFQAFLSATGLAVSFLLLKQALLLGMHPVWASFVRMSVGGAILWVMVLLRGELVAVMRRAWTSWPILRLLLLGCCVSTFGNCLAPVAMKYTQAGIAATLIGLQPVMIIIITALADRKPPTFRAVVGTLIAFSGTAMIFLR